MSTTIKYLNAVIAKTGAASDYAVAKKLGVTVATVSVWRCGKGTMSNEICLRVADLLEVDPVLVVTAIQEERAKNPTEKALWHDIFERLGGVAAALVLGVSLTTTPTPAQANSGLISYNTGENCILCKIKRRKRLKKQQLNPFGLMINQILGIA